jgi:DNA-binding NarL/FixJ family response regulator
MHSSGGTVATVARDVQQLPGEAPKLGDPSERERAVLALISDGLTSREIARRIGSARRSSTS